MGLVKQHFKSISTSMPTSSLDGLFQARYVTLIKLMHKCGRLYGFLQACWYSVLKNHASAFDVHSHNLLYKVADQGRLHKQRHNQWLETIQKQIWDRVTYENDIIPYTSTLWRHWLWSCWVTNTWKQADKKNMVIEAPQKEDRIKEPNSRLGQ